MASFLVEDSKTATLAAGVADTVTFNRQKFFVRITNHNIVVLADNVDLWVRFDGTAAVAEADNTFCIPIGGAQFVHGLVEFDVTRLGEGVKSVSIVSAAAQKYTVEAAK